MNPSTVYRLAKREDVKPSIEKEQIRLVEAVPDAVDNVKRRVRGMKSAKDLKERELGYKASTDTLKAVGIMPTPVQSRCITNIYNDQRTVISPFVQAILDEHHRRLIGGHSEIEGKESESG
jgi:hypothetical protein